MKVMHVPYTYHPEPLGGTEVYVEALVDNLVEVGVDCAIAAPGRIDTSSRHKGIPIYRMKAPERDVLADMYGSGDIALARRFGEILDSERPDLVHFHAFSREMSLASAAEARRRACRVVFTYHTPAVSCPRSTLLRWGEDICDGKLDANPCTACLAHALGVNRLASSIVGAVPPVVGAVVAKAGLEGRLWTALRLSHLVRSRNEAFCKYIRYVDHVVAVCEWVRDLLLRNDAIPANLSICRQGLCWPEPQQSDCRAAESDRLRIAFFGRLETIKGPEVILDALRLLPNLNVQFDIFGIVQGPSSQAYAALLREKAASDPRVELRDPVASQDVVAVMRRYDVVAVPSLGLETGPLVVLEAFGARVPVLASDLGGARELVSNDVDGWLIEPGAPTRWAEAIRRLSEDGNLVTRLRQGIKPPRTMKEVAKDMAGLYFGLCRSADPATPVGTCQ
jgi:glycosyltransferase involved in cell wall biosynthesis